MLLTWVDCPANALDTSTSCLGTRKSKTPCVARNPIPQLPLTEDVRSLGIPHRRHPPLQVGPGPAAPAAGGAADSSPAAARDAIAGEDGLGAESDGSGAGAERTQASTVDSIRLSDSGASVDPRVSETTTPPHVPGVAAADYRLAFTTLEWDFGELAPGTTAQHALAFKNIGDREVKITDVLSTCSCPVPSLEQRDYLPGEAGRLDVILDAADPLRAGSGQRVTVLTDAAEQSTIVLGLHADIRAELVVTPATVDFF